MFSIKFFEKKSFFYGTECALLIFFVSHWPSPFELMKPIVPSELAEAKISPYSDGANAIELTERFKKNEKNNIE